LLAAMLTGILEADDSKTHKWFLAGRHLPYVRALLQRDDFC
jgi:hypothetical protein